LKNYSVIYPIVEIVNLSNFGNPVPVDSDIVAKSPQKQKALDGIHDVAIDSHDVIMERKPRSPE
jgi:hypothetical protein